MEKKTFLAFIAILLVAGSMACAYAAQAPCESINFDVPDDFKVDNTNDTAVVLKDDKKTIMVSKDIIGEDAVNAFLTSQGFKFVETNHCTTTVSGTQSGTFTYDMNTYAKTGAGAAAYFLVKDNAKYTVIAIDNDVDADDDFKTSDVCDAAEEVVKAIMLAK